MLFQNLHSTKKHDSYHIPVHVPPGHVLGGLLLVGEGDTNHTVLPQGAHQTQFSLRHMVTQIKVVEQVVCRQLGSRQEAMLLSKTKHHVGALAQALVWNVGLSPCIRLAGKELAITSAHAPNLVSIPKRRKKIVSIEVS